MKLGEVYRSNNFVGAQCADCDVPGYIVLRAEPSAEIIGKLSNSAKNELGNALATLEMAIRETTSVEHVYALRFSEALGDVHFHLFPRSAALADEFLRETRDTDDGINGPLLFAWARKKFYKSYHGNFSDQTLAVAFKIQRALSDSR